ncbi:MAG: flagellar biosynthetic protein FliR [Deltaproteobacteria bacterium]|nr:flagellar biosynthetic protein FliR [Deltaproteobacteria bacterium]
MTYFFPDKWLESVNAVTIFFRFLGLFLLMPGFSHKVIPPTVKILLAVAASFALYPVVKADLAPLSLGVGDFALRAIGETAIGLLMGLAALFTFEAISFAAQLVGYQMGFGTVGLMDPNNSANVSVLVPLQGWIALMIFFAGDFHHQILQTFVLSFKVSGAFSGYWPGNVELLRALLGLSAKFLVLGVQMAAPFTLLILLCNAAIGVLARTLPQMNILLFSFPITITLGLCAMYLFAPELLDCIERFFGDMSSDVLLVLKTI